MSVDSAVSDVLAMDNDIRVATARGAPEYLGKKKKVHPEDELYHPTIWGVLVTMGDSSLLSTTIHLSLLPDCGCTVTSFFTLVG